MVLKYKNKDLFPKNLPTAIIVETLVAGPTNNKTKAAPGDAPFNIRLEAIGVAEVEQI